MLDILMRKVRQLNLPRTPGHLRAAEVLGEMRRQSPRPNLFWHIQTPGGASSTKMAKRNLFALHLISLFWQVGCSFTMPVGTAHLEQGLAAPGFVAS